MPADASGQDVAHEVLRRIDQFLNFWQWHGGSRLTLQQKNQLYRLFAFWLHNNDCPRNPLAYAPRLGPLLAISRETREHFDKAWRLFWGEQEVARDSPTAPWDGLLRGIQARTAATDASWYGEPEIQLRNRLERVAAALLLILLSVFAGLAWMHFSLHSGSAGAPKVIEVPPQPRISKADPAGEQPTGAGSKTITSPRPRLANVPLRDPPQPLTRAARTSVSMSQCRIWTTS